MISSDSCPLKTIKWPKHFIYSVLLLVFCLLSTAEHAYTQQLAHTSGEILLQVKQQQKITDILSQFRGHPAFREGQIQLKRQVEAPLNVYQITFDPGQIHEGHLLETLRKDDRVEMAQFNHFIQMPLKGK
ncbi:MAG: hypothetical protein AAFP19_24175 [Bacteroidota bacterium]